MTAVRITKFERHGDLFTATVTPENSEPVRVNNGIGSWTFTVDPASRRVARREVIPAAAAPLATRSWCQACCPAGERPRRTTTECRVASKDRTPPRGPFRLLVESRLQGLYASRDVVAGRPALFGRTAASLVTDWPRGIPAGVEGALAPCPRIRVR